jgi:exodeoxyribonuclease VII large subunit
MSFSFSQFSGYEQTVWRVSELTSYIRQLFELDYRLQDLDITGEISNFSRAASGHLYFTLKDASAQIKCVMWRTQAERLRALPADGDAVIAHGRISVYETGGVYQLYVDSMHPAGRGDLALSFERLKEKLTAEGLFDGEYKKPIPPFPGKIGIVTSVGAAALRDILIVLQRRNPLITVLIAPTLVQGEAAPSQIIRALRWLDDRDDIDTIILARGGGSIEDLWAFNDEQVARAIFTARHPIISGVGHETDFTIADFVADLRAPTPSAAAELAAPDLSGMRNLIQEFSEELITTTNHNLADRREILRGRKQVLWLLNPRRLLDSDRQHLDNLIENFYRSIRQRIDDRHNQLMLAERALSAVSPIATLGRGFAIVRDESGQLIRSVTEVRRNQPILVQVSDGSFEAEVTGQ